MTLVRIIIVASLSLSLGSCANYKIIQQTETVMADESTLDTAVLKASENLGMTLRKRTDSTYQLIKHPLSPWDKQTSLKLAKLGKGDSVRLVTEGVMLNPGGYVVRHGNEYAFMLNSAISQEIAFYNQTPLFDKRLPEKKDGLVVALSMLNPGLGAYYGYNTPLTKKIAVIGGITCGLFDALYIALLFMDDKGTNEEMGTISNKATGIMGMATFRLLIPVAYFIDSKVYKGLQNSPYYFDLDPIKKEGQVIYKFDF